jgi:carboxymethylenebutenolidase
MAIDFRKATAWDSFDTSGQDGMTAEVVSIGGSGGDRIHAYAARPSGNGPFPGVVLVHHMPGCDEIYRESTRRFAQHGYNAICPDLYCREGHGKPDEVSAAVRAGGGIPDDRVVADLSAAMKWLRALPTSSGKVGIIGTCSGGRHALLAASREKGFDAVADLWGGGVVMAASDLTPKRPVAPIDLTKELSAPLLGLFGNDDKSPTPEQVDQHEAELKKQGKRYEFHRYDGAGHGFFYYHRPSYRPEQAMDGWAKVFAFFATHLAG